MNMVFVFRFVFLTVHGIQQLACWYTQSCTVQSLDLGSIYFAVLLIHNFYAETFQDSIVSDLKLRLENTLFVPYNSDRNRQNEIYWIKVILWNHIVKCSLPMCFPEASQTCRVHFALFRSILASLQSSSFLSFLAHCSVSWHYLAANSQLVKQCEAVSRNVYRVATFMHSVDCHVHVHPCVRARDTIKPGTHSLKNCSIVLLENYTGYLESSNCVDEIFTNQNIQICLMILFII